MVWSPRLRVFAFLSVTFLSSSFFYTLCIRNGMKASYIFRLMWCPGLSALLVTLLTKRSFREFGWQLGRPRYLLAGWSIPMAYSWPAYLVVWATGLGGFPKEPGVEQFRSLLHLPSTPTWLLLALVYVLGAVVAVLFSCLSAAGEEIGWRGFLVPELMKFNSFTRTALISGVVWSCWHVPLIVWSGYNSGTPSWYAVTCFAVMVISISFVFTWIRLKSGSVWPAVLLHASHNAIIQGYLDALTVEHGRTKYFTGEFGCAMLPLTILCAYLAWRQRLPEAAGDSHYRPLAAPAEYSK
jgi:uncharacterized protein